MSIAKESEPQVMTKDAYQQTIVHGLSIILNKLWPKQDVPEGVIEAVGALTALASAVPDIRKCVPTFRGIWKSKTPYARGSICTYGGSMWHSNEDDNLDKPGSSDTWTLCVKRGRDGRNADAPAT